MTIKFPVAHLSIDAKGFLIKTPKFHASRKITLKGFREHQKARVAQECTLDDGAGWHIEVGWHVSLCPPSDFIGL